MGSKCKQRVVVESFMKEWSGLTEIHTALQNTHGNETIDRNNVQKRTKKCAEGETSIEDEHRLQPVLQTIVTRTQRSPVCVLLDL